MISEWYEQRRLKLIARMAGDGSILDCGYVGIPNKYFTGTVTGIDLDEAPPSLPANYSATLQMDITKLADSVETYDTIVAGELIEHLENAHEFLRATRRLLKPGGSLILSTPNPLGFPIVFAELFQTERFFYTADHRFLVTPRWMKRMLVDSGFTVDRVIGVGLWLPKFGLPWSPATLSYQVIYEARPASDQ